ncbi:hypothetical protein M3Y99_00133400 [Aphelenchoides fujianensis]|nr:hypothetical protein M3Y99_00133400 [Aphelenchoides fujianensis]
MELNYKLTRGLQLVEWAREAGLPSLELDAAVRLPNPITNRSAYEEVWSNARELFAEQDEFELKTENLDEDLVEAYGTRSDVPFGIWKGAMFGHKLRFLFFYCVRG